MLVTPHDCIRINHEKFSQRLIGFSFLNQYKTREENRLKFIGEWPVTVFRSRVKGPKRESRGSIFHRYPPHELVQAIVLACILRHVGATRDDIAHQKLPRWYEPSFYYRTLSCGLRSGVLNARPSLAQLQPVTPFEKGISSLYRETSHMETYVPNSEWETWKLHFECIGVNTPLRRVLIPQGFCKMLDIANYAECFAAESRKY